MDRDAWRSLPLQFIVIPTLGAPSLVFPPEFEGEAMCLYADIADLHYRWKKAFTVDRKIAFARRIRRAHLALCSLAIGVRVPGSRAIHCFLDVAADDVSLQRCA